MIGYSVLPENQKTWIKKLILTDSKEILVEMNNQLVPVVVSNETYEFSRNNLKKGDQITLYYKAIANKTLCYDPYHKLYSLTPKEGMQATFMKVVINP